MHSLRLNINDKIFDNIMFFLNNIPSNDLEVKEIQTTKKIKNKNNLVQFFQTSPIVNEINLTRNKEVYKNRVIF